MLSRIWRISVPDRDLLRQSEKVGRWELISLSFHWRVAFEKGVNILPSKPPVTAVAYPVSLEQAAITPQPECIGMHAEQASYLGDG